MDNARVVWMERVKVIFFYLSLFFMSWSTDMDLNAPEGRRKSAVLNDVIIALGCGGFCMWCTLSSTGLRHGQKVWPVLAFCGARILQSHLHTWLRSSSLVHQLSGIMQFLFVPPSQIKKCGDYSPGQSGFSVSKTSDVQTFIACILPITQSLVGWSVKICMGLRSNVPVCASD